MPSRSAALPKFVRDFRLSLNFHPSGRLVRCLVIVLIAKETYQFSVPIKPIAKTPSPNYFLPYPACRPPIMDHSEAVNPSMLISRQINELLETVQNAKIQMAKAKQAMRLVENSLNKSCRLITQFSALPGYTPRTPSPVPIGFRSPQLRSGSEILQYSDIRSAQSLDNPPRSTTVNPRSIRRPPSRVSLIPSIDPPLFPIPRHNSSSSIAISSDVFVECPDDHSAPQATRSPLAIFSSPSYRPCYPPKPFDPELFARVDSLSVPSATECLHHVDDFLLYASSDCSSCLFHRRSCNDAARTASEFCVTLPLQVAVYHEFLLLLRRERLPICQICFIPLLQHHTDAYPSLCMHPTSVAPLAFLLWNEPSTLGLVVHALRRVISYDLVDVVEFSLPGYVNFLATIVDKTPMILLLVGVYWFLYDQNGILPL
ncbi:hypothetical protein JVT61DRAFT_4264 [Boletus reticuloceps]|uniref:Uncharacterized protein n=1 Tax=Boletus reticuloceps TaxID=495285 RepID=A0A8I2YLX1_9AGAM|nr:hypothetical protein JVT61DRAFT_4264 [Boletus reticuloceps]